MFNIIDLYNLFKPLDDESRVTAYPVIFGGTSAVINTITGGFIITQISSNDIGSPVNVMVKNNDDTFSSIQKTLTKNVIQIDFYKAFNEKDNGFIVSSEINKVMQYLKSYEALEYLKALDYEILPNYSNIQIVSEYTEQKSLVNRAFFDFSIISTSSIIFDTIQLEKIKFNKGIIV